MFHKEIYTKVEMAVTMAEGNPLGQILFATNVTRRENSKETAYPRGMVLVVNYPRIPQTIFQNG